MEGTMVHGWDAVLDSMENSSFDGEGTVKTQRKRA